MSSFISYSDLKEKIVKTNLLIEYIFTCGVKNKILIDYIETLDNSSEAFLKGFDQINLNKHKINPEITSKFPLDKSNLPFPEPLEEYCFPF